ncbi:TerD family protein [Neobacillus sp. NPDC097160]|uniref:TerD family protein n=1 Tax=Neobacillus sp. NPDC097160 TaxID=3364298 RepID=UPI0037F3D16F
MKVGLQMSLSLVKGQKADITKTNSQITKVNVEVGWNSSANIELDASSFLLAGNGKVRSDADFVFYGQPSSSCGSVTKIVGVNHNRQQFQVTFNKIPAKVKQIVELCEISCL